MGGLTVAERVEALLDHLSLARVHVGACMSADWRGLVGPLKDRVSSLALVAPHLNQGIPAEVEGFRQIFSSAVNWTGELDVDSLKDLLLRVAWDHITIQTCNGNINNCS